MKIVITTGQSYSDASALHQVLAVAGVASPVPSRRENLSVHEINLSLLAARDAAEGRPPAVTMGPGTLSHELASDLILANLDRPCWGWNDPRSLWLADFWLSFDAQTRFLLVYCAPSAALVRAMNAPTSAHAGTISSVLDQWCAESLSMLKLTMRHPGRCMLVHDAVALGMLERTIGDANAILGLELHSIDAVRADIPAGHKAMSALETLLASATVGAFEDALALFHELEGCAHVPSGQAEPADARSDDAWTMFRQLNRQLDSALHERDSLAVRLDQDKENLAGLASANTGLVSRCSELTAERELSIAASERHARTLSDLRASIDDMAEQMQAARSARDALEEQLASTQAEAERTRAGAESLVYELHSAHLEAETLFARAEASQADLTALAASLEDRDVRLQAALAARAEVQLALSAISEQLVACRRAGAAQDAAIRSMTTAGREVARQRDMLRLNAMQMDAEIARIEAVRATEAHQWRAAREAADKWRALCWQRQAAEVSMDLRQDIVGSNWYGAESDGRWTGPSEVSTLSIPALAPGRYAVQILIVGSMSSRIVDELQVVIDDVHVPMGRSGKKHPYTLSGDFVAPELPHDSFDWQLILKVPQVMSPADRGSPDQRQLGVRIGQISFTLLRQE